MVLRVLIAAACLVVIAAGSMWIWQQFRPTAEAREIATRETCLAALDPWVKSGATEMDAYLVQCRDDGLIELRDVTQFME